MNNLPIMSKNYNTLIDFAKFLRQNGIYKFFEFDQIKFLLISYFT